MKTPTACLILGIGNLYRKDDGVGPLLAQRLKGHVSSDVTIVEKSGEGADLMESWKNAQRVILIDAVASGSPPGTVHRFEAHTQTLPQDFFHYSTHAFSVAEAIELARALGELPPSLVVYGIEGKDFESGEGLSTEVEKAAKEVEEKVLRELENHA